MIVLVGTAQFERATPASRRTFPPKNSIYSRLLAGENIGFGTPRGYQNHKAHSLSKNSSIYQRVMLVLQIYLNRSGRSIDLGLIGTLSRSDSRSIKKGLALVFPGLALSIFLPKKRAVSSRNGGELVISDRVSLDENSIIKSKLGGILRICCNLNWHSLL